MLNRIVVALALLFALPALANDGEDLANMARDYFKRVAFAEMQAGIKDQCVALEALEKESIENSSLTMYGIACRHLTNPVVTDVDAIRFFNAVASRCRNSSSPSAAAFGLTTAETYAICFYTNLGYEDLAKTEYGPKGAPVLLLPHIVAALDRALNKLPPYQGIVTRMVTSTRNSPADFKRGRAIPSNSYVSSSFRNPFKGNIRYIIKSKSGRDIHELSELPGEYEVLFPRGTVFTVSRDAVVGADGILEVHIDEN